MRTGTAWLAWIVAVAACTEVRPGCLPGQNERSGFCVSPRDASMVEAGSDVATMPGDALEEDSARDGAMSDAADVTDALDVTDVPGPDGADVMDAPGIDVADGGPSTPRPVAPISLGDVTQRRPTLRWVLPAGFDRSEVQLCRDRACSSVIETLTVTGTSARPGADLPARSVVFWRVRARATGASDSGYGPTWLFHVPAVSASTSIDTSFNPHFDVNGDGFDDVVIGALQAAPSGRARAGTASVYLGGVGGIPATPQRLLEGGAAADYFGRSVAGAGDVNGDGYGDLVVGADQGYLSFGPGAASVYLGGADGIPATPQRVLVGRHAGDGFGFSVASAGDVNADGYADLVVGSSHGVGGATDATAASVFLGGASGISATAQRVLSGMGDDEFGNVVAGAGDVNGDGYSDIFIGAPHADPGGRRDAGTASVFLGGESGIAATPHRVFEGEAPSDALGFAVAGAGDVNGDGFADIVLAASAADPGGRRDAGTVSLFLGSTSGIGAIAQRVLEGGAVSDAFGRAVAGAGDVNGDGFADVVVGTELADPGGRNGAGTASLFHGGPSGIAMTPQRVLEGNAPTDYFGNAVAGAGDLNGDGFADLVVGAIYADPGGHSAAGAASTFLGGPSGIEMTPQRVLTGVAENDYFGQSVACAGQRVRPSRSVARDVAEVAVTALGMAVRPAVSLCASHSTTPRKCSKPSGTSSAISCWRARSTTCPRPRAT